MSKRLVFPVVLVLGLVGAALAAQQPQATALKTVSRALGAEGLKTLRYTGSGSSYVPTDAADPAADWTHTVMSSYVHELNFDAITSHVRIVRGAGTTVNSIADTDSPWSLYEFWLTPHGFVKGAEIYNATIENRTVSFTPPGGHKVVGYFNEQNLVEKVETWVGEKGNRLIEAGYRDYADFNGVQVPTMITQKHDGELSLIVIVKEVQVGK